MPDAYAISMVADRDTFQEDVVMTCIICVMGFAAAAMVIVGRRSFDRKHGTQGEKVPLKADMEAYGSSREMV